MGRTLDEVLRRCERDAAFRRLLDHDPVAALAPYDLTTDELTALVAHLADDSEPAEQRARRSAFVRLLAKRPPEERGS